MFILKLTYSALTRLSPRNSLGDKIVAYLHFIQAHGRPPAIRRRWFNDQLYATKTSRALREPLHAFVADKEHLKLYVKAIVGDALNVPTYAVLRTASEVERYNYPRECCIKPTHMSGLMFARRDGAAVPVNEICRWLQMNHYERSREPQYQYLSPKIIVEELLTPDASLLDFKFFCWRGRPNVIQVDFNRFGDHKRKYFDRTWRELEFSVKYPRLLSTFPAPPNFDEMLAIAAKLSAPFEFVRVDLYNTPRIHVGEITHVHGGAGERFVPPNAEAEMSERFFDEGGQS